MMENSITSDLITVFEDDQRKVVFSALSDYLHLGLFTDVSLTCGLQMVRAHKVVLAASSKFFRDAFKHCPSNRYNCVSLNFDLKKIFLLVHPFGFAFIYLISHFTYIPSMLMAPSSKSPIM
jgi:hypothetical protein